MLRALVCAVAFLAVSVSGSVNAQDEDFLFDYNVDSATVCFDPETGEGDDFTILIRIEESEDSEEYPNDTEGFSMGVAVDPLYFSPIEGAFVNEVSEVNDGDGPEFFAIDVADGDEGFIIGCVYALFSSVTLELDGTDVLELTFGVISDDLLDVEEPIETDIIFSDVLTAVPKEPGAEPPPVSNVVVVNGLSYVPTLNDGTITLDPCSDPEFLRGDVDGNGVTFPILDALFLLEYGFTNGDTPPCFDAADVDDNGIVFPILDGLFLLEYGFTNGPAPADPGALECGPDGTPDDDADCETPPDACL